MIIRRESRSGSNDLHVVYRPCKADEIIGNETNKRLIKNTLDTNKVPHTQLFTGVAGCGKTTAAKIVALGLNCEKNGVTSDPCLACPSCKSIIDSNSIDVKEINVGQSGGKDAVDSIVRDLPQGSFNSRSKVIIFDEAHKLTPAAKDLLLKPTENGYEHVYFIFCTDQPEMLKSKNKDGGNPFLGRCSTLNFSRITPELVYGLLKNVCDFEGFKYNKEVLDLIASEAGGVPRNALIWLNQVAVEGSWDIKSAQVICNTFADTDDPQVIELCRALNEGSFKSAINIFEGIKSVPTETLRIIATNYFVACLKRSKDIRDGTKYSKILDILLEPIHEQGKLADYRWYNYMFKVVDVVLSNRRAK